MSEISWFLGGFLIAIFLIYLGMYLFITVTYENNQRQIRLFFKHFRRNSFLLTKAIAIKLFYLIKEYLIKLDHRIFNASRKERFR